jgi:co-chaperonin GroES (HSP10)
MIKLTKQELAKFKPLNNLVLLKPLEDRSKYQLTKDIELKIDIDFTEFAFKHINVINKVIAVPDKIICGQYRSDWKTEVEIQVGDTVVVNQFPIQSSVTSSEFIVCEGEIYYYVRYSDIYCKYYYPQKKNFITDLITFGIALLPENPEIELAPINGYVLAEPVIEKSGFGAYITEKETNSAIVKFIGSKNTDYWEERFKPESQSFYKPVDIDVEVGDEIHFTQFANRKLDNGLKSIFGNLIPVMRKDITYLKRGDVIYG